MNDKTRTSLQNQLITDTDSLARFCRSLKGEPYITIDTEFMRDRTYWPKLCLVQVAGEKAAVAIDSLSPELDMAPFVELLMDESQLKVLHACRQDLEIFYRLCGGKLPRPIFDTQVAAMVCGFGEEVAYETLVNRLAKAKLDKSSRFTDWSSRPLSPQQIRYALSDVTHLRTIFERLAELIDQAGRRDWVFEELESLLDPAIYELDPDEAWRRLKFRSREPRFVGLVQALAAWRERKAQARDLPRNRIIRDDLLLEVAANRPTDVDSLKKIERVNLDRESVKEVAALIAEVMARDEAELPTLPPPRQPPKGVGPVVDLLKVLLKLCSEESGVAQRLIAGSADLEALAEDDAADIPALKGWRHDIFGKMALDLKHGRTALAIQNREIRLIPTGSGPTGSGPAGSGPAGSGPAGSGTAPG